MDAARLSDVRTPFDLVRIRRWWFALSGAMMLIGFIALARNGLNLGTDFLGGAEIQYRTSVPLPTDESARASLVDEIARTLNLGSGAVKVIQVGEDPDTGEPVTELLVRVSAKQQTELKQLEAETQAALESNFSDRLGAVTIGKDATFIGPVMGRELRRQAVWSLIVGLGLILLYIRQRYNIRMATGGVAALFHDVTIMLGMMALGRWEINAPFVAAVLTVVGYSINDSVVIFDRIRENMQSRASRTDTLARVVNYSLWQTMARSINTVLTVVIVLVCLLLFGGATLREFSIALLIGIVCGCYSSIFTASQFVVEWEEWALRRKARAKQTAEGTAERVGMSAQRRRQEELRRAQRVAAAADRAAEAGTSSGDTPPAGIEEALERVGRPDATKPRAQAAKQVRQHRPPAKSRRRH